MKSVRIGQIERLLDRQARLWQSEHPHPPVPESTPRANLALAQPPGSGARELAERIAATIGWQVFDRQILAALHANDELGKSVLESLDERLLGYREDWIYHLFVPDHMSSAGYVQRLSRLLSSLAMQGRGIFVGRGASFVIPPQHRLAVLVVRDFESRLERWRQELPPASAAASRRGLRRLDRWRGEFVWRSFHRLVDDPLSYDLCVHLDRMGVEAAARTIVLALQQRFPHAFAAAAAPPHAH